MKSMGKPDNRKQKKWWQILLLVLGWIVLAIVAVVLFFIIFLSATEFKPAAKMDAKVHGSPSRTVQQGDTLSIMTWNMGFGALGDNADFFMDGGNMVKTADEKRVRENVAGVQAELKEVKPDAVFLQEIDIDSDRSYKINEVQTISDSMPRYSSSFANNFKVRYDPYPIPPMGKIDSGICTLTSLPVADSYRLSLPVPFKWPVRLGNLKRCLLVSRVPLKNSNKELIFVNLHLEAYDDGAGKAAQTRKLREILDSEVRKGNYVIAGGDFNQVFSNVDTSRYPQRKDTWAPGVIDVSDFPGLQMRMDSSNPSCRSLDRVLAGDTSDDFQWYVIDGFISSRNIRINSCRTQQLHFRNSDHNPVILNATLL